MSLISTADSWVGPFHGSGTRVVPISAPAGYGKTSLLAEWAATEDRTTCCRSMIEEPNG